MMRSARGVVAKAAALAVLVAILALAAAPQRALAQQCANPGNDGPGGTITGIINTYYPGTANALAGATSLTVGASSGAATPIASGDLLLVIQMQDAGIASTNNDSYGDGVAGIPASGTNAINNAGRYEFVRATSSVSGGVVSIVGEGAGNGLVNAYTNAAATGTQGQRRFQVIRVPQYSSATIGAGLVALYWSGTVGGVLVFDVAGTLNFNSQTITLTGRGFRGGGGRAVTGGGGGANTDHRTVATSNYNGAKAEGVAGTPRYVLDPNTGTLVDTGVEGYPNGSMARGAPGNAGGGGTDGNPATNDQNSGGGGGGNGGTGGTGGNTWSSNLPRGGYGGAAFPVATTRLAMGGGGGAGARNNSSGVLSSGGAGGGIVMIRAGATSGTATITTDGVTGLTPANDGGGGGGAGGSVLVYSASGGLAGLTVNARGAGGSNADVGGSPHGPGAGGGGGYVALSSAAAAITVTGGAPGFTVSAGNNYGATAGTAGSSVTTLTSAGITGVNPSSECVPQITVVKTTSTPTIVNGPSGTTASYTLTITNTAGLSTATQVAVLDTLPTGFTFASTGTIVFSGGATRPSTTNPTVGDVVPSWSTFTIPSGGSVTIPFTANVASTVTAGTYQNPATSRYLDAKRTTAAGTTTSTYIASGSTGEDVTVTIPDLSLDKRHTAAFTVGQNGVYMIVVRNVGNAPTIGTVTVLDTIPATLTSPVGAGAGWTCTTVGQIVTATYAAAIAAGDSAKFTITAGVTAAAYPSVINAATASGGGDNSTANNRDSDPTAITGVPDVTIDKRHVAAFTVGQSASYTIVVHNIGTAVTANPVVVRDTLPTGLTGATGSGAGWTYVDGAIEVATLVGSIAAGDSAKFTVTVNVGAAAYPSVTNAATVSLTGDLDPSNNRDTDPTPITGTPDVTIDKRHTAAFTVGQSASYTIVVRNIGTGSTVGAVTVRDTLPLGLSGATGTGGAGWSFSDGAIEVATYAPVIAAGDSAKFTLTVNVGAAAFPSVTNAATVSLAGDLDPSNNRDTDPTAITGVPDVTIDKRHTAAFTVGQAASYTIVVRNIGTVATASTTTVLDTLPTGLTPGTGSGTGWSFVTAGQIVTANYLGAIAAGDSAQFTIPVTVGALAYPSVINAATVSLSGDLDPTNNRDTDPTAITGVPDVSIDKRHTAAFTVGQGASYTIVVRNFGTVPTVGATTVRDTLPGGLTYGVGSASGWTFSNSGQTVIAIFAAPIADGDSAQFTLPVTVDATAFPSVINAASVSSANDLDPSNNRDTDPTAITGVADLSIDKRHTAVFVDGQSGLYRFVVTNLGTAPSVGVVTVSDTLPAGLTYVPGVTPGWTVSNTLQIVTATYNLAIAPLDSAQFTVTVSISTPAVPSVINAATVSNASDVNPANDRDLDPTTVNGSTDVAIDKRHTGQFEINTNDTYTIVVRNVGTGSAGNFALADTLPAGLTYFSYAGAGWTLPVLAGQIVSTSFPGTLAAGDSAIFTLTVTVDVTAFPVVVNSAVVNAPGDVNPANDRDVDSTRVRARPDLSITKRHSVAFVDGQDAAWTIVLTNVSSVPTSIAATVTTSV